MRNFIHRPYIPGETIAAVATPPGEGGVAMIRISGRLAVEVAAQVFAGPVGSYKSHVMHFGKVIDSSGRVMDEVLLVVMKAPHSYTGEETVEIHCHGGSLITRQVLQRVLDAGARAALPGEFTLKAYMNGKMDLAQAEAVQTLIAAKSDLALKASESQLQGMLSKKIRQIQKELLDIAAILEAWVDFPEEGLEFASLETVSKTLSGIKEKIQALGQTFEEGKILHEGLLLCLSGAPNVGKSSLMNALLGKDRAIVTEIAGTTRDVLEADLRMGGLHFKLVDTAGIRETQEVVEREGIRRSTQALQQADLILLVLDAAQGVQKSDIEIMKQAEPDKTILVWNKVDLPSPHKPPKGALAVSAKQGEGLAALKETVQARVWKRGAPSKEEVVITSIRHFQSLESAAGHVELVLQGLQDGTSPEFLADDMRSALQELGTIIGQNISEEILSAIFSKFCVGK